MAEVGVIWTRRGEPVLVDVEDLDFLSQWTWHIDARGYVQAGINGRKTRMHRLLCPGIVELDHQSGDKADNRRSNLRAATRSQNMANRDKFPACTSKYKGVSWHKRSKKWQARISYASQTRFLGYFRTEHEAAAAYNQQANLLFQQFARLQEIVPC